jgi:hypothetical protein
MGGSVPAVQLAEQPAPTEAGLDGVLAIDLYDPGVLQSKHDALQSPSVVVAWMRL